MARPYKLDISRPELIEQRINDYFTLCENENKLPLFPELLLHLDITRDTWDNYTKPIDIDSNLYNTDRDYKEKIDNKTSVNSIFKKAETRLEAAMSREAATSSRPTAAIFLLKQRFYGGYQDRQDQAVSGDIAVKINLQSADGKTYNNSGKTAKNTPKTAQKDNE